MSELIRPERCRQCVDPNLKGIHTCPRRFEHRQYLYDIDPVLQAALAKCVRLEAQITQQKTVIETYRADIFRLQREMKQLYGKDLR